VVGTAAPILEFRSFTGGTLALDGLGEAVVLGFLGADCERCLTEAQKLSVLSTVYYEDMVTAAISREGEGAAVQREIDDAAGTGLVLGGEDTGDAVARELGIKSIPTLVVIGPSGTIDAIFTEDVPLNVLYAFLKNAYSFEGEGDKPYDPADGPVPEVTDG
jgi:thiol-disulfide isomerase/thioredoxin